MAFARSALKAVGLNDDQIEAVMALHGQTMSEMVSKTELESAKKTAVEEALKNAPAPDIKKDPEYQKLLAENKKITALTGEDFKAVKTKFREDVWRKLDHDKEYPEQLKTIQEEYPEYFTEGKEPASDPQSKPQFGSKSEGSMPPGSQAQSFADFWGFKPKKE